MSEQEQKDIPNKVALVIVAHPDDAEFGAAGTVATWAKEGWDIYYVICTDASGGGADDAEDVSHEARKVISDIRKEEQRAACEILGVKGVEFLDYPDGQLEPSLDLRRKLVRLMRKYRPYRIICQSPDRLWEPVYAIGRHHPDHLAAGQATIMAMYPASQNGWDFPELLKEGYPPHKVKEIYFMGAPNPNFAVDVTAAMDAKLAALRAHESQLGSRFEMLKDMIRERTAETGKKHDMEYAEEFHRAENW